MMMRRAAVLMLAMTAAVMLGSCSSPGYPHVLNGSGAPITLRLAPYYLHPTSVTVKPGGWARIIRFRLPLPGPTVLARGCAYTYDLPTVPPGHPFDAGIDELVQVNPDHSAMALSPRARVVMPVEALEDRQPPGFPVRPISVSCGQASAEAAGFAAPVRAASARL